MKAALALALSGCAFGAGGARMGKYVAHQEVDVDACLVDDRGSCTDHREIAHDVPARSYWGVMMPFPTAGVSRVTEHGETRVGPRAEASLEILRGRGPFAVGVRAGMMFDGDAGTISLAALAHYALTDRLAIYGGPGVIPTSEIDTYPMPNTASYVGARAIGGLQLTLARHAMVGLEGDALWLDMQGGYRSFGLTGHLGFIL